MTYPQQIITIIMAITATVLTRFLPFIIFPKNKPTPKYITYLGNVLPTAVFGLLVVYCLKDISIIKGTHGLPELISIGVITIAHLWKKQMLVSILLGTVTYMFLIQFVF